MTTTTSASLNTLFPGATIGVVGGGQLGRYFVLEARRLGYHTWVLDPDPQAPAMQIAEHAEAAAFDDTAALERMAKACDAVTIEFENVPAASLDLLAKFTRVAPSSDAVHIAQDRVREKVTAREAGLQPVPFAVIESSDDIDAALNSVTLPAILKTTQLGYDGKGQIVCETADELRAAFDKVNNVPCVLEQRINLQRELSVVLARGFDGVIACFPVAENVHVNGILHTSLVPSACDPELQKNAELLASKLANHIDYHGVMAVEFFCDEYDQLLFNEMAPRPHNSGHYTLDASISSQFEQQLRVLCALPLGDTVSLSPVVMLNLLGDSWAAGEPDWQALMASSSAKLHLYGKTSARPARKMGHVNCLADTPAAAMKLAIDLSKYLDS